MPVGTLVRSTLFSLFAGGFLVACGSGGGGGVAGLTYSNGGSGPSGEGGAGGSPPSAYVAPGYIQGAAFDSEIYWGDVAVYDYTWGNSLKLLESSELVAGKKGTPLTTQQTSSGVLPRFQLTVTSRPILVRVSGGSYIEEASGVGVSLPSSSFSSSGLYAVANYVEGETLDVNVTFLTTVAAGYAGWLVSQGETPTNAVIAANEEVSRWVGFDILKTKPLNVTDPNNASSSLTDGLKYGFISAGLSQLSATFDSGVGAHVNYPSYLVIDTAYEDVKADGKLDGVLAGGVSKTLGVFTFDVNSFRGQLAARILQFSTFVLNGELRNKTGLDFASLKNFAVSLASYAGPLFGSSPAKNLFSESPTIGQFLPEEGRVVSGCEPVRALVSDTYGSSIVNYYVDGDYVAGSGATIWGLPQPDTQQCIVTTNFPNGWHLFEIRVTNIIGQTTSVFHNVDVQN